MRILHLIADARRRGSQLYAVELAAAQRAAGNDAAVAALVGDDRPELDVEVLGLSGTGSLTVWGLRSRVRDVDVCVAHGPVPGEVLAKAVGRSTPFVYRHVRDTRGWVPRPTRPKAAPRFLRRAAAVVAMSAGARTDLIESYGLLSWRVHEIPIAVSSEQWTVASAERRAEARLMHGLDDSGMVVLALGPLVPELGADVAIRAVAEVDGVTLLVVGDGPERARLELLADGLAAGRVVFAGRLANVSHALAAADVLVRPSTAGDSMPRPIIEAGLCGLPVVASSIGSIGEVVVDGQTGSLVQPGDAQGLRTALLEMRLDPQRRQSLGVAARERCLARFDLEVVERRWAEVLERVVAG